MSTFDKKGVVSNITFDTLTPSVSIFDLETNQVESLPDVFGWCEGILVLNEKVYIANTSKHQLLVYDIISKSINSISMPKEPMNIVVDRKGKLWILCSGGYDNGPSMATLVQFDPNSNAIVKTLKFADPDAFPSRLIIDELGENLYFLSKGVFKVSIDEVSQVTDAFIKSPVSGSPVSLYGLKLNESKGKIYVGDAKDFSSKGKVYVYNLQGNLLESFETGIAPNGFIFR
jgi:DNA-binding beta-propeller fold protein YncE